MNKVLRVCTRAPELFCAGENTRRNFAGRFGGAPNLRTPAEQPHTADEFCMPGLNIFPGTGPGN